MMKYRTRISLLFLLAALLGCSRSDGNFENKLFIDSDSFKDEVRVATDENVTEMSRTMSVAIARPLSYDLEVTFAESEHLLSTYREAYYDPEAELLPEGHCNLSSARAVIKAGEISSGDISFDFVKLDKLDYSKRYVLPVTVVSDRIGTLPRASTMYFVVRKAAFVNVAADLSSNFAWPEWGSFSAVHNMEHFTFEALVNGYAFDNDSDVHTLMGIEDVFLLRAGDAGLPGNQLQVAYACKVDGNTFRGSVTSSASLLRQNRWHHVAVTFDGGPDKASEGAEVKLYIDGAVKAEGKCSVDNTFTQQEDYITSIDFMVPHSDEADGKPRCFWIGYSYDKNRCFNGMISEVRVWNKTLTEDEINAPNHFYKLYPDPLSGEFPDELVAYWKFNDEKGQTVKDWSIYGNNLSGDHDFVWYSVELPSDE